MTKNILNITFIVLFLFLDLGASALLADEIDFDVPDSFKIPTFWDKLGKFSAKCDTGSRQTTFSLAVIPESDIVGEISEYEIELTVPINGIPRSGGIAFAFPDGFELTGISKIEYSDNFAGPDLVIKRFQVDWNIVSILFKKGDSPPAGTIIALRILSIKNPTRAGEYQIAGLIFNRLFVVTAGPSFSDSFSIKPAVPERLEILPAGPIELRAGEFQKFIANGYDRFGNLISGFEIDWSFAPEFDSLGTLSDGNLFATITGEGKVQAGHGELTANSGLITVLPGKAVYFELKGYPSAINAGDFFPEPVVLSVYDAFDNLKYDYSGSVFFTSTDAAADLFYNQSNQYQFTADDSGSHSFEGSGFKLKTSGWQRISASDGAILATSDFILVNFGELNFVYAPGSLNLDTILSPSKIDALSLQFEIDKMIDPEILDVDFNLLINPGESEWVSISGDDIEFEINGNIISLYLENLDIPNFRSLGDFPEGEKPLAAIIEASCGGQISFKDTLYDFDSVVMLYDAELSYISGSLSPDSVIRGGSYAFELDISLAGQTSIKLDSEWCGFQALYNGGMLDIPLTGFPIELQSGSNHLTSGTIEIPTGLTAESLTPRLILSGMELYADRTDTILFGDDIIRIAPNEPAEIAITPDGPLELRVGEAMTFAAKIYDAFGSEIRGLEIEWFFSMAGDSIGILSEGNLLATIVGRGRVIAKYNTLADTSGLITVLPGELDHFAISGLPLSVMAGEKFGSDVMVAAYDGFGNIKYDYDGEIYFLSTDNGAELPFNQSNRYEFIPADSGRHIFSGGGFSLSTVGRQTITVTDGEISATSGLIIVGSGGAASYELVYEPTVRAGDAYLLSIVDAEDAFGNAANGQATVILESSGSSPEGFSPAINDIYVQDGEGSSVQYLFATGPVTILVELGGVRRRANLEVLPAELGRLALEIQPTQFLGHPLIGPATITCYDIYGNVKTDFDASETPVELTADKEGLNIAEIDNEDAFKNGVADLELSGIIYNGTGGEVMLAASIEDLISEAEIIYNGIEIESYYPIKLDTIIAGEGINFSGLAYNRGDLQPITPVDFVGYFESCAGLCRDSSTFRPLFAGENIRIYKYMNGDSLKIGDSDTLVLYAISRYLHDNDTIEVKSLVQLPKYVIEGLELRYVEGSFSIDTIIAPSGLYEISMQLEGDFDLDNIINRIYFDAYYYSEDDEEEPRGIFGSWRNSYVISGNKVNLQFIFTEIPEIKSLGWFSEGYRLLNLGLYLGDNRSRTSYVRNFIGFDSVYFAFSGNLAYEPETFVPKLLSPNRTYSFEFDLNFDGNIDYAPDTTEANRPVFQLLGIDTILTAEIIDDSLKLRKGINHLTTGEIYIPSKYTNAEFSPRLIISGRELYASRTDTITFGDEFISVSDLPGIQVYSTSLIAPNPPFLNYGQHFAINIAVRSFATDTIYDATVYILSDPENDTVAVSSGHAIYPSSGLGVIIPMIADSVSHPAKIYRAAVSAPNADILPPEDNSVAITVQSPAELNLEYSLIGAYEGYVEYGQTFTLQALLSNDGEAEATSGELTITTGGVNFGIPDPLTIVIDPDSISAWALAAPSVSDTAIIKMVLSDIPIDKNTGQTALVKNESLAIMIIIEPSAAELVVNGVIGSAPLVIKGSQSELFTLEMKNNTDNELNIIGLKSIDVELGDRKGNLISPDLILDPGATYFLEEGDIKASGAIIDDILRMSFEDFRLGPKEERAIVFRAKFLKEIDISGFSLHIENQDIKAIFVAGPRLNQAVPVVGEFDNNFRMSGNFTVTPPSLEQSLMIRNNPFNPEIESAEIAYNLERDADVSMRIFTLAGEKVRESEFRAGSVGGRAGNNTIEWDGKNDKGKVVVNGVYVVVIRDNSAGESYKIKLAVMK
jgi:hypothetical protein